MSYQSNVSKHNFKVRMMLFFLRPIHIFNVFLLVHMWKVLSYGPSTFPGYFGRETARQATMNLWSDELSSYVWYFILAAIVDAAYQEVIPLINNK